MSSWETGPVTQRLPVMEESLAKKREVICKYIQAGYHN
jgi:hypothetical protein